MSDNEIPVEEIDQRANLLWQARRTRNVLDPQDVPWSTLTAASANQIGERLYQRGGRSRTWKLGAFDGETQHRLGLSGPVCLPMLDRSTETDVRSTSLRLKDLVAPRFEVEIGIILAGDGIIGVPCVEIADCRFADWRLPPFGMTVELGLQGRMVFGLPGQVDRDVQVTVSRDDKFLVSGSAGWHQAVSRLDLLANRSDADHVATGSITEMLDCVPGRWRFDFGVMGDIVITVK